MNDSPHSIYDAPFQQRLFDEMQGTYESVSNIASFGFNRRWRRQLIQHMNLCAEMRVCDLMAGSGESWTYILPKIGPRGKLIGIDFSQNMIASARTRRDRLGSTAINIDIRQEDVFTTTITPSSVDAVLCVYGVKTLAPADVDRFVLLIKRLLKPHGNFGLVEISVPGWLPLRVPYLFYLRVVVPLLGKVLLGNPDNYRMLNQYTERFGNCSALADALTTSGFFIEVETYSFFWGCATAITGVCNPVLPQEFDGIGKG